jgi:hypothetical protein
LAFVGGGWQLAAVLTVVAAAFGGLAYAWKQAKE